MIVNLIESGNDLKSVLNHLNLAISILVFHKKILQVFLQD